MIFFSSAINRYVELSISIDKHFSPISSLLDTIIDIEELFFIFFVTDVIIILDGSNKSKTSYTMW